MHESDSDLDLKEIACKITTQQLHDLIINFWKNRQISPLAICDLFMDIFYATLNNNLLSPKLSLKRQGELLKLIFETIAQVHSARVSEGRCAECNKTPGQLCKVCAAAKPLSVSLEITFTNTSNRIIHQGMSMDDIVLNEVEWCPGSRNAYLNPWVVMSRFSPRQQSVMPLLIQCWVYLYERAREDQRTIGKSKSRPNFVKDVMRSNKDNAIKELVTSGLCIGCGEPLPKGKKVYCKEECEIKFNRFFKDWTRKPKAGSKPRYISDPYQAAFDQVIKRFDELTNH